MSDQECDRMRQRLFALRDEFRRVVEGAGRFGKVYAERAAADLDAILDDRDPS